jgi:ribosomal protein L40E
MSSLSEFLDWVGASSDRATVHVECRQCGTTLSEDATSCPSCGSREIATISLR